MLRLVVEDNGCGPAGGRFGSGRGLGVIGMRERAQALGGTFALKEREAGGTSLVVTLPLETGSVNDSTDSSSIRRAG
jgi:signal transduction histidine kinase